jgi:hypothetical protein
MQLNEVGPRTGCIRLFFGYNCYNFGLDFTGTLSFNATWAEDRKAMVAENFETYLTALGLHPATPGQAATSPNTKGVC